MSFRIVSKADPAGNDLLKSTIVDAKGDLIVATSDDTINRLPVGSAGQALVANSATTTGLAWQTVGDVTLVGTQTLTNKTIDLTDNTVSGTLAEFNTAVSDADLVSLAGTETLTNKTLSKPNLQFPNLQVPLETANRLTGAPGSDISLIPDSVNDGTFVYYSTALTQNFSLSVLGVYGFIEDVFPNYRSLTYAVAVTNGATPYRITDWPGQAAGYSVRIYSQATNGWVYLKPKWQGGSAPTTGNANSVDMYTFTFMRHQSTISEANMTVFASMTRFA